MARLDGSYSNGKNNYTFFSIWEVTNTSEDRIANNRSLVRVAVYGQRIGSNLGYYNNYNHNCSININGNNETKTDTRFDYRNTNEVMLYQREIYVQHNDDGTKRININATHYSGTGLGDGYLNADIDLPVIPREANVINDLNWTINNIIQLNIKNPGNFNVGLDFYVNGSYCISKQAKYNGITNISLTEAEQNIFYSKMPNKNSDALQLNVGTTNDSGGLIGNIQVKRGTIRINSELVKPIFSNYIYEDTNAVTINLTGNNQKFIKDYSNLKVTIPSAYKAIGSKGATILKYRLECGEYTAEANYSVNDITMLLNNVKSNIITVKAIDSRNNITSVSKNVILINYAKPIVKSLELNREGGTSTTCSLISTGAYDSVNFGAISNSISRIEYKKNTGAWTDCTSLFAISNGSFNAIANAKISSFKVGTAYVVQLRIIDKLENVIKQTEVSSGDSTLIINMTRKTIGVGKIPDTSLLPGSIDVKNQIFIKGQEVLSYTVIDTWN